MGGIYQIRNIINNKIYIGSTKNFDQRKYRHFLHLRNGEHHSILLQRAYNKYGEINFVFEVLEECEDQELIKKEQEYLDNYKPFSPVGYNISTIASNCVLFGEKNGMYGKFGENNPNFGTKATEKRKKLISEKLTGIKRSKEFKKICSERAKKRIGKLNPMYGKQLSEERREYISKLKSQPVIMYDVDTGNFIQEFPSAKIACQETGIDDSSIIANTKQKIKTAGKYIWRKKNEIYKENTNLYDIENLPAGYYLKRNKKQTKVL